jgi:hypothetical protein
VRSSVDDKDNDNGSAFYEMLAQKMNSISISLASFSFRRRTEDEAKMEKNGVPSLIFDVSPLTMLNRITER